MYDNAKKIITWEKKYIHSVEIIIGQTLMSFTMKKQILLHSIFTLSQ